MPVRDDPVRHPAIQSVGIVVDHSPRQTSSLPEFDMTWLVEKERDPFLDEVASRSKNMSRIDDEPK
jgi:hypothetical protein